MFVVGCSEINMSVVVKHGQHIGIIRLFACPSFSVALGTKKNDGLWFASGASTQAGTMVYILVFLLGRMGGGPSHQLKICLFSPPPWTWKNSPSRSPLTKFLSSPISHQRLISPSSPLNNNFHVMTQWKRHF